MLKNNYRFKKHYFVFLTLGSTNLIGRLLCLPYPQPIKTMIKMILIAALALLSQAASAQLSLKPVDISTIEYPSLFQREPQPGLGYGAAQDITSEAFQAAGIGVTYSYQPMIRSVESVIEKRFPANLGSINWFIKDGKQDEVQSVDLLYINFKLFYLKSRFPNETSLPSFEGLKTYRVGNVRGSSTTPVLQSLGIEPDWISTLELNFRKLAAGRVDFAIAGEKAGWTLIDQLSMPQEQFGTISDPIHVVPISLVFHKDAQLLQQQFKSGLCTIIKDGRYLKIMQRYYSKKDNLKAALLAPLPPSYC